MISSDYRHGLLALMTSPETFSRPELCLDEEFISIIRKQKLMTAFKKVNSPLVMPASDLICRSKKQRAVKRSFQSLKPLFDWLNSEQIDYILFKGAALSQVLYSDPFSRQFGDIDLLIPHEAIEEAHRVLAECGYYQRCKSSLANPSQAERNGSSVSFRQFAYSTQTIPYKSDEKSLPVDLHDGVYFVDSAKTNLFLKECDRANILDREFKIANLECALLLLILNAYENSESIFSNLSGGRIKLGDYYDIHELASRHSCLLDSHKLTNLMHDLHLEYVVSKVLGNYESLYCDESCMTLLGAFDVKPKQSAYDHSLIDRALDDDIAYVDSRKIFEKNHIGGRKGFPPLSKRSNACVFQIKEKGTIALELNLINGCMHIDLIIPNQIARMSEDSIVELSVFPPAPVVPFQLSVSIMLGGSKLQGALLTSHRGLCQRPKFNSTTSEIDFEVRNLEHNQSGHVSVKIVIPEDRLQNIKTGSTELGVTVDLFCHLHGSIYHQEQANQDALIFPKSLTVL